MAEVGLDKVLGGFSLSGLQSSVYGIAEYVIWGVLILGVVIFAWLKWQDKKVFIYPVRIFKQRANGLVKEQNVWGGYKKVGNISTFVLKMSAWGKKPMEKLPNSEYMDEENRIYYWQVSPDSPLIQVSRQFIIERVLVPNDNFINPTPERREEIIKKWTLDLLGEEEFKDKSEEIRQARAIELYEMQVEEEKNKFVDVTKPTYSPVPTDLKQQAMAEINNYRATLGVDTNKQIMYFTIGVIALVVLAIILFYIASNKGDIPILTK